MINLTKKQQQALDVIMQHFATCVFTNKDIQAIDSTIATATTANLAKIGILYKEGKDPVSYKLAPQDNWSNDMTNAIIELETGEVYINSRVATETKGAGFSKIKDAVAGRRKVAGKTHWCKVCELPANYTEQDRQIKIDDIEAAFGYDGGQKMTAGKRVINITTGQEFYTAAAAAKWYHCSSDSIAACCRGEVQLCCGCEWKYSDSN